LVNTENKVNLSGKEKNHGRKGKIKVPLIRFEELFLAIKATGYSGKKALRILNR